MKWFQHQIKMKARSRGFHLVTREIVEQIPELSEIDVGILNVFIQHSSASLTLNENADPDVTADMDTVLDRLIPWSNGYRHFEGNTAAHVKASMMGSSVQVIIEDGQLQTGTWQSIYFCEFDGPRTRKVWLQGTPAV